MRLSTKGRYAARIMVCLAMRGDGIPSRKQDIAEAEGLSVDYVAQILMRLKGAGLIASHRGAKGGFVLARDPAQITIGDVLLATEGPITLVSCFGKPCRRASVCVTREVWQEAGEALAAVFSRTSIGAMAERAKRLKDSAELSYAI